MEFDDLIKKLEATEEFTAWKKDHPKSFLAHVFVMIDQDAASGYQIGYYDTTDQKITSFLYDGSSVKVLPASEVFKDPNSQLHVLDVSGISFSTQDVLAKAHLVREEDYADVPVMKVFFILQNVDQYGCVFNVTFVTQDLKTLNVKLEAKTGEVLSHTLQSLVHKEPGL